ncbi:hypothetical protein DNTS_031088 [Danionella cerebrum]|uniref:non-specific serine/threonine protein kinase n=1 Tax=Danionella cerebrum TaxID=2873325 RepID=A0A553NLX8_9TELE|nr:hypothetical protein DNTS_031088 [Danionella translucida]
MGALLVRGRSGTEVLEAVRLEDGLQVKYLTVGRYCGEPATVWSLRILSYVMLRLKFPRNRQLKKLDEGTWRKRRLSMECHDFLHRCLQTEPSNRLQLDEVLLHPWFNDHSSHFYLDSDDSFSSDTSIEEIGDSRTFQMSWRTRTSWKTEQLVFFFTMLFLISLLTFIVILLLYFS